MAETRFVLPASVKTARWFVGFRSSDEADAAIRQDGVGSGDYFVRLADEEDELSLEFWVS
jgi:hypothetical protein